MPYQGSCHCGRIRFKIEGIDLAGILTRQFDGRAL